MTIEDVSGYRSVKSLMGDDGSSFPKDFNFDLENDIAALLFSSGTSGFPKPVMLNHRSLVANLQLLHRYGFKFEKKSARFSFCFIKNLLETLSH